MNVDKILYDHAIDIVNAMDKAANEMLPKEIVDVVKIHSKIAVGSAWIPIPGVDVAAGAANIWTMYIRINNKIGFSISENVIKTIGGGVATNLASFIAMSGLASAIKCIPGIGTVGGAILQSAALYAITLTSGYVYLRAIKALVGNKKNFSEAELQAAVKKELSNKADVKRFFEESKRSYKK